MDLTEKLWPAFLAEVTEHLEALELALVGRSATDIADINAIFRSFHTIKGGCAMMGFGNMEVIAHASEDLLDPLRKGQRPITDALVTLLLEVRDCLKTQLAESARSHKEPSAAPALLARLQAARGDTPPTAQNAAAVPAASTEPIETAAALGFAQVARQSLPGMAGAILADKPLSAAVKRDITRIAEAARESGVIAVTNLLARLVAANKSAERAALFADVVDRLAYVESVTGLDCGTGGTGAECRRILAQSFGSNLQALQARIAALTAALAKGPAETRAAAALVSAAIEPVVAIALLLRLRDTTSLLRLTAQILREIARGGVDPGEDLAELLAVACSLGSELEAGLEEDAPYRDMCATLRDNLQRAAATRVHGGDAPGRAERIRHLIDINHDVLDTLTATALDLLESAIARNETIVEIEADLEATPDFGQEFVAWLSRNGTLISNHTVFHVETAAGAHTETTRLRFLAALRMSTEDVRLMLGEIDPQRRFYDLRHCARLDAPPPRAGETHQTDPAQPARDGAATPAGLASATLRIDSGALDRFVDRVGEMVMLRNMLSHALYRDDLATRLRRARALLGSSAATGSAALIDQAALRELLADLESQQDQLSQTDVRMLGALGRMQEDVLALRVVPIGMVFNRLPRVVRDLSHAQGKTVSIDLQGEDVRIDKGMVDLLLEPLMHMVRNAIDHGIESPAARDRAGKPATATLSLTARQQGNTLQIEVADDGAGLDIGRIRAKAIANGLIGAAEAATLSERELANFIFLPGFSTAERVTEVSGRGVGMDVVKTRIAQIGGQIDVRSTPGQGVTFVLKLPLSVAIQSVVHVAAGNRQLAIPDRNVLEIMSVPAYALQSVQGQAACLLRGATLPVYNLAVLLGDAPVQSEATALEIVVMTDGVYRIGLQVDRVLGRPEVFVRDIHPDLARIPGVGGASVLGDGRVVIILDCENLFELALRRAQSLRTLLRAS